MPKKNRFIGTVLGIQGSGKTHLIQHEIIPRCPTPIFILDTMDEYGIKNGRSYGLSFYSMKSLKYHIMKYNKNLTGINILKADNDEDCLAFFELFTRVKEPATLIIEESSKFCSPYSINDDLDNIINYGRHWGQNVIFVARRPAELHRSVTANSDFIVSFVQTEYNDINKLKKSFRNAALLPELKEENYEFTVFRKMPDGLKDLKKLKEYRTIS